LSDGFAQGIVAGKPIPISTGASIGECSLDYYSTPNSYNT